MAPIFSEKDHGGFEQGFSNLSYLVRRLIEHIFLLFQALIVFAIASVTGPIVFIVQNLKIFLLLFLCTGISYYQVRNDAELKLTIDNLYTETVYPYFNGIIQPASEQVHAYASFGLIWWNAYHSSTKIFRNQFIGILWQGTKTGEIKWSKTFRSFRGVVYYSGIESIHVVSRGVIYSDLNVSNIFDQSTQFIDSFTDKTGALCRDANFVIELGVKPLLIPELRYAVTDVVNATWMIPMTTVRWGLSTVNNFLQREFDYITSPNYNAIFDQYASGLDSTGIWVDKTLDQTLAEFVNVITEPNRSIRLPQLGVTVAKGLIVIVRISQFVVQGFINIPFWFTAPKGSVDDPLQGYFPREMLGLTLIPGGDISLLEKVLSAIDSFAYALGDSLSFIYDHLGKAITAAILLATNILRFVFLLIAHIVSATRGESNFASFLSKYDYFPIRSQFMNLIAALVELLTSYYEPLGYVIFSVSDAALELVYILYRVLIHLGLLGTPEGKNYFKNPLNATYGLQKDLDSTLNSLDNFAGNVGGLISSFNRFAPNPIDAYNTRSISSLKYSNQTKKSKDLSIHEPVPMYRIRRPWKLLDVKVHSPSIPNHKSSRLVSTECSKDSMICAQVCNDWCTTDTDACAPDPWPQTTGRSSCLYGVRNSNGNTIASGCIQSCAERCSTNFTLCTTDTCNLVYVGSCIGRVKSEIIAEGITLGCGKSSNPAETRCVNGNLMCCIGGLISSALKTPVGVIRWVARTAYSLGVQDKSIPTTNIMLNPVRSFIGSGVCIISKIYVIIVHPQKAYYVPDGLCSASKLTCIVADVLDMIFGIVSNSQNLFNLDGGGYVPDTVVATLLPNLYSDIFEVWSCGAPKEPGYNPLGSILSGMGSVTIYYLGFIINLVRLVIAVGIEIYRAIAFPIPGISNAERFFSFMAKVSSGEFPELHDLKASAEDITAAYASIAMGIYQPISLFIFDTMGIVLKIGWWIVQTIANLPALFGGSKWNSYFTDATGFLWDMDATFIQIDKAGQSLGGIISGLDEFIISLTGSAIPFKRSTTDKDNGFVYYYASTKEESDNIRKSSEEPDIPFMTTTAESIDMSTYLGTGTPVKRSWVPSEYQSLYDPGWVKNVPHPTHYKTSMENVESMIMPSSSPKRSNSKSNSNVQSAPMPLRPSEPRLSVSDMSNTTDYTTTTGLSSAQENKQSNVERLIPPTGYVFPPTRFKDSVCALVCNSVCYTSYSTNKTYTAFEKDDCFVSATAHTSRAFDPVTQTWGPVEVYELSGGCYFTCTNECKIPCSGCTTDVCDQMCAMSCATRPISISQTSIDRECVDPHFNAAQIQCKSKLLCCFGGFIGSIVKVLSGVAKYIIHATFSPFLPKEARIPRLEWILSPVSETISYAECTLGRIYQIVLIYTLHPVNEDDSAYLPPLMCLIPSIRCVVGNFLLLIQEMLINASDVFSSKHYFKTKIMGISEARDFTMYTVVNATAPYQILLSSFDGLCSCFGSIFSNIYYPLDILLTQALRMVSILPRIPIRLVVEFAQPTPGSDLRKFLTVYDFDGLGDAFDNIWAALGMIGGDIYPAFTPMIKYGGLTVDSIISLIYNLFIHIDIMFGPDGFYNTEVMGSGRPIYNPGHMYKVESNMRSFFFGFKVMFDQIWPPLGDTIYAVFNILVSLLNSAVAILLQFATNITKFPSFTANYNFDNLPTYLDILAVRSGNMFSVIHPCAPTTVTSSQRLLYQFAALGIDVVTFAPNMFSGGDKSVFVTRIFANATGVTNQIQEMGNAIGIFIQNFGSTSGGCTQPVNYNGTGVPGNIQYNYTEVIPIGNENDNPIKPIDHTYTNSNDSSCEYCCSGCCKGQIETLFQSYPEAGHASYFADSAHLCQETICGPECECKCDDICGDTSYQKVGLTCDAQDGKTMSSDLNVVSGTISVNPFSSDAYSSVAITFKCSTRGSTRACTVDFRSDDTTKSSMGNMKDGLYEVTYNYAYACNNSGTFPSTQSISISQYDSNGKSTGQFTCSFKFQYTTTAVNQGDKRNFIPEDSHQKVNATQNETDYISAFINRARKRQEQYSGDKDEETRIYLTQIHRSRIHRDPTGVAERKSRAAAADLHWYCNKNDVSSCSYCNYTSEPVTFNGFATYQECKYSCEGNNGSYPLCDAINTTPSSQFNRPKQPALVCSSVNAANDIFCCAGLTYSAIIGLTSECIKYGLSVVNTVARIDILISTGKLEIPKLNGLIDKLRVLFRGVSCIISTPFVTTKFKVEFANLVYSILNLVTVPLEFINTLISMFLNSSPGFSDIGSMVKDIINPLFDVFSAFIAWLSKMGVLNSSLAGFFTDMINLGKTFFGTLGAQVLNFLLTIVRFVVSIFAFFTGQGSGTAVVTSFKNLFIDLFTQIIPQILTAILELIFPPKFIQAVKTIGEKIVDFFQSMFNCFKSFKKFIKCIFGKRSEILSGKPIMTCMTCKAGDIPDPFESSYTSRDVDSPWANVIGIVPEEVLSSFRVITSSYPGFANVFDKSSQQQPQQDIKRRARSVRPNPVYSASKITKMTGRQTTRVNPESVKYPPYGAILPDDLPNDYLFFLNISSHDVGFEQTVERNWPFSTGTFSRCDSLVRYAAQTNMTSMLSVEVTQYFQCLSTLFATRLYNMEATDYNAQMYTMLNEVVTSNNSDYYVRNTGTDTIDPDHPDTTPVYAQDEYGDYYYTSNSEHVFEVTYTETVPDEYYFNTFIQRETDIRNSPLYSASTTQSVAIVTGSPEWYYYQYNDYIPPNERNTTSTEDITDAKRSIDSRDETDLPEPPPFVGRFDFYSKRSKTKTSDTINGRTKNNHANGPDSNMKDPDYDPRYDKKSSKRSIEIEDEWNYEYLPRGKIPYAELVTGILDAYGITDAQVVSDVIRITKKFSPGYHANILDKMKSIRQKRERANEDWKKRNEKGTKRNEEFEGIPDNEQIEWKDINRYFGNMISEGIALFQKSTFVISKEMKRSESLYGQTIFSSLRKSVLDEPVPLSSLFNLKNMAQSQMRENTTTSKRNTGESKIPTNVNPSPVPDFQKDNQYKRKMRQIEKEEEERKRVNMLQPHEGSNNVIDSGDTYALEYDPSFDTKVPLPPKYEPGMYSKMRMNFINHRGLGAAPLREWWADQINTNPDPENPSRKSKDAKYATPFYNFDETEMSRRTEPRDLYYPKNKTIEDVLLEGLSSQSRRTLEDLEYISESGMAKLKLFGYIYDRMKRVNYPLLNIMTYITRPAPENDTVHTQSASEFYYPPPIIPNPPSVADMFNAKRGDYQPCSTDDNFMAEICVHCALLGSSVEAFWNLLIISVNKSVIVLGGDPIPIEIIFSQEDIEAGRPYDLKYNERNTSFDFNVVPGTPQKFRDRPFPEDRFSFTTFTLNLPHHMATFTTNMPYYLSILTFNWIDYLIKATTLYVETAYTAAKYAIVNSDSSDPHSIMFYFDFALTCNKEAIDCSNPQGYGLGLPKALLYLNGGIILITLFLIIMIPGVVSFFWAGVIVSYWPLLCALAYFISPRCTYGLSPYIPECLASDVNNFIQSVPAAIPWPDYLISHGPKPNEYEFVSCSRDRNFYDAVDSLAFLIQWKWRQGVTIIETTEERYVDPLLYDFTKRNKTLTSYLDQFETHGNPQPDIDIWCFYETILSLAPAIIGLLFIGYMSYIVMVNCSLILNLLLNITSQIIEIPSEFMRTLSGRYSPDILIHYDENGREEGETLEQDDDYSSYQIQTNDNEIQKPLPPTYITHLQGLDDSQDQIDTIDTFEPRSFIHGDAHIRSRHRHSPVHPTDARSPALLGGYSHYLPEDPIDYGGYNYEPIIKKD